MLAAVKTLQRCKQVGEQVSNRTMERWLRKQRGGRHRGMGWVNGVSERKRGKECTSVVRHKGEHDKQREKRGRGGEIKERR